MTDKVYAARNASCLICNKPWGNRGRGKNKTLFPTTITQEDGKEVMILLCHDCFLAIDEQEIRKKLAKETLHARPTSKTL